MEQVQGLSIPPRNDCRHFYIGGRWVDPGNRKILNVVNPATGETVAELAVATESDVDGAVSAAVRAFDRYSRASLHERAELLERITTAYKARAGEMALTISREMGAPITLSRQAQVPAGLAHFQVAARILGEFRFEEGLGSTLIRNEPIGVCAMITPWNWPMNQICCKVAPALAAGCTMVLKPSELAPLSAQLFAEILDEAGVPPGVFNLVHGDGPASGASLAAHPDVAMVSFTGSARGGLAVAIAAAPTIKRVTQELGGKSAYIVLPGADLGSAAAACARACFRNSGQSCNAPTRLLVQHESAEEAAEAARLAAEALVVGDPTSEATEIGPLTGPTQFDKVQAMIQRGLSEGGCLVAGGLGRPAGLERGYFARPTVFSKVTADMTIAQEEIFGPVLSIISYADEADAIRIANGTRFGLSNFVVGPIERAREVARKLRSGNVHINGARLDFGACFGGFKHSGNGREWGIAGLREYLELKAIFGYSTNLPAPQ